MEVFERLIDTVLSNPIMIVIVIGVVSSLISRARKKNAAPSQTTTIGGERGHQPVPPYGRAEDQRHVNSPNLQSSESPPSFVTYAGDVDMSSYSEMEEPQKSYERLPVPHGIDFDEGSALTREELARAMVLAEIVGPPRAKKPFIFRK